MLYMTYMPINMLGHAIHSSGKRKFVRIVVFIIIILIFYNYDDIILIDAFILTSPVLF